MRLLTRSLKNCARRGKSGIISCVLSVVFVFFFFSVGDAKEKKRGHSVTCKSIILSDNTQAKRLYGRRVYNEVLPASTTKVMTALLVLEKLPLSRYVTVSEDATHVQPTKLDLKAGEQYKVQDLLYAVLLKSANDASIVLAEAVAGSEEKFVEMMNRRAGQLGASRTRFANSHGLPSKDAQHTTAYDMYLIFRKVLEYDFFRSAIKEKYKTIHSRDGREIVLKSHNKILFSDWKKKIYGKTGYTRSAGACFIGTLDKKENTLIIGVFGCTDRWKDIKHVVSRYGGVAL